MLIVAGTVRVPPENLDAFRPHMAAMMAASQAEAGCLDYNYAEDVTEPGLLHVFERWESQAHLDAHFKTPHMARWRAAWPSFSVSDRRLFAYEVGGERAVYEPSPHLAQLCGWERATATARPSSRLALLCQ